MSSSKCHLYFTTHATAQQGNTKKDVTCPFRFLTLLKTYISFLYQTRTVDVVSHLLHLNSCQTVELMSSDSLRLLPPVSLRKSRSKCRVSSLPHDGSKRQEMDNHKRGSDQCRQGREYTSGDTRIPFNVIVITLYMSLTFCIQISHYTGYKLSTVHDKPFL